MLLDLNTRFQPTDLLLTVQRAVFKTGLITKPQLSKMHPWKENGAVEVYSVKSIGKRVFLLRSYQNVHPMMNRWMDKPGYWKKTKYDGFVTDCWYPYQQRKRPGKAYEDEHIVNHVRHSLGITDGYCAFYQYKLDSGLPVMTAWQRGEDSPYQEEVKPDAVMTLFGVEFLDEYECGHHPILTEKEYSAASEPYRKKTFNYKIARYLNFFRQHPDRMLLIRVQKWLGRKPDKNGTDELFDQMWEYLTRVGHQDRILIARHTDVCGDPLHTDKEIHHDDLGDPLGKVWFLPSSDDPTSIQAVLQTSKHISK